MNAFWLLTREAVADAIRRRIVIVIAAVSLLSLLLVESCTSCAGGELTINGEAQQMLDVAGYTGGVMFVTLTLWCVALAGVLAAEHLAEPFSDGSATLVLARPVGRGAYVYARLAGALFIAIVTGAFLLGGTAFFLHARSDLAWGPALQAGAGFAGGAITVGALAMTASLFLPRIACVVLVFATVGLQSITNVVGLVRQTSEGWLGVLDRLGPPLAAVPILALDPWAEEIDIPGELFPAAIRLAVWAAFALGLLWIAFRRVEVGR